ncbi:MAG: hypothetical protein MRY32_04210 [Rickettsiales bacterium]|nr:hypothetical protein [Rickettsiales bacterium]
MGYLSDHPDTLAALAISRGDDPAQSMAQAAQAQIYQHQLNQTKMLQEKWPIIQEQLKGKGPQEAFSLLAPLVGVEQATKVMEQLRIGKHQQMVQDLMTGEQGGITQGREATEGQKRRINSMEDRGTLEKLLLVPELAPYAKAKLDNLNRVEEKEEKRTKLQIPGFELDESIQPKDTDVKDARSMTSARDTFNDLIDEYKELITENDGAVSETLNPTVAKKYKQLSSQLALIGKDLYDLGALQEPDRKILEDLLVDPTGFMAQRIDASAYLDNLDKAKGRANEFVDRRLGAMGYDKTFTIKGRKVKMSEIKATAEKYEITPEEVIKRLKGVK